MTIRLLLAWALTAAGCDQLFELHELPAPRPDAAGPAGDGAVDTRTAGAARYVFVSSVGKSGNMGGLAGADAFCQELANQAKLAGTYKPRS